MTPARLVHAVLAGQMPDQGLFDALSESDRNTVIESLIEQPEGRRWLRMLPWQTAELPDRLLAYEADFHQKRRDASLVSVVNAASEAALVQHATAIAASPAAQGLWTRLRSNPEELVAVAAAVVATSDAHAAESTLYLVVLDALDPYQVGPARRQRIASAALSSASPEVRGLAAEYLARDAPQELLANFERLTQDDSERVRGIVWNAALRLARADARDLAFAVVLDEAAPLDVRRSALIAVGSQLPTLDLIDLLSLLVAHPNVTLASDAANLLYNQHRQPDIALAAQRSPHPHIREIAETLLDPLRGSPAAGGSRPGDPTRATTADIYRDALRQFEQRADETDPPP